MLLEIKKDYVKYKDKLSILKLMELFNIESTAKSVNSIM